jgi:hypothetical protein
MKMDRDDGRADERGSTAEDPAPDDVDDRLDHDDQSDEEEEPPRPVRLGAAWRLPVILAAAEMDDEDE